jgi:hypothetical protein
MNTRRALLRSAALALAVAVVGSTALAPSASAAQLYGAEDLHSVAAKTKKEKSESHSSSDDDDGIGDIPIIGDVVGQFQDAEPEEIVSGAITFAGAAAETAVPLIRSLIK